MAKNNNLTDFLTGVADAIRAKKGTTDLINPQNFESEIESISSGVSFNIEYSDEAPTDTTKLWIKAATPSNVKIDSETLGSEILQTNVAKLDTSAYGSASATVGSKIYLLGRTNSKINRVFDTTTNTISKLSAEFSEYTDNMAAESVGSKIYLFGGMGGSSGRLNTIRVYDTTTDTISTLSAKLPTAANYITSATVGNKIYLFGGEIDGYGSGQKNIYVFDTTSNALSTSSAKLPKPENHMAAAAVGSKIYLFGGRDGKAVNTIRVFDTITNTVSTLSVTLPTIACDIAAVAVGNKIYLFGGFYYSSGSIYLNTINVFDTTTNTISTLSATLPMPASEILASTVGTKIYLIGGYNGSSLLSINAFIIQSPLNNGNIQIVMDTATNLFDIITDEALQMRIGVKQVFKGNADNVAELCDAYLHNGTNWVNVNTGEIYST